MQTTADLAADLGIALPRTGSLNNPAAQGRLAALRTFAAALTTLDGVRDYDDTVRTVLNGRAPEPFKTSFVDTLRTLCATFDSTMN